MCKPWVIPELPLVGIESGRLGTCVPGLSGQPGGHSIDISVGNVPLLHNLKTCCWRHNPVLNIYKSQWLGEGLLLITTTDMQTLQSYAGYGTDGICMLGSPPPWQFLNFLFVWFIPPLPACTHSGYGRCSDSIAMVYLWCWYPVSLALQFEANKLLYAHFTGHQSCWKLDNLFAQ